MKDNSNEKNIDNTIKKISNMMEDENSLNLSEDIEINSEFKMRMLNLFEEKYEQSKLKHDNSKTKNNEVKLENIETMSSKRNFKEKSLNLIRKKNHIIPKIAIACVLGICILFPNQIRIYAENIIDYVITRFEKFTSIQFQSEQKTNQNPSFNFIYTIPEDFKIVEEKKENYYFASLKNNADKEIVIFILNKSNNTIHLDTEDARIETIIIKDTAVTHITENETHILYWIDDNFYYEISSNTELEVILKLAKEFIK